MPDLPNFRFHPENCIKGKSAEYHIQISDPPPPPLGFWLLKALKICGFLCLCSQPLTILTGCLYLLSRILAPKGLVVLAVLLPLKQVFVVSTFSSCSQLGYRLLLPKAEM